MLGKRNMLSDSQLASFCQQIGMVIKAGLPTHYGISILLDEASDEKTIAFLKQIYIPMEKGATLCSAIADTGVFPEYMVRMIGLGEETGRLEEVLDSLAIYYEKETDIHIGIKHAITYPLILAFLLLLVISIVMTQVIPVFASVYEIIGATPSSLAYRIIQISEYLNRYFFLFTVLFIIIMIAGFLLYKTALGKALFQGKGLSMTIASNRFANCMYMTLASGLDTDRGLELAASLVDNPYMVERIHMCQSHMKHGETFGKAIIQSGIFSKIYGSLISLGEKTGSMDNVMLRIGQAYEEETEYRIRRSISILEPTLIIILSLFIGLIILTFLLPLLGVMSSIG